MPSKGQPLYYWDSSVFISWLLDGADRDKIDWLKLQGVAEEIAGGKVDVITSVITRVEILDKHCRTDKLKKFQAFLERPRSETIEVGNPEAEEAGRIRAHFSAKGTKLPLSDAIHLATAGLHGATHLHTFDREHLLKLNGTVPEYSLIICKPEPVAKQEASPKDKNQLNLLDSEEGNAEEGKAEENQ